MDDTSLGAHDPGGTAEENGSQDYSKAGLKSGSVDEMLVYQA